MCFSFLPQVIQDATGNSGAELRWAGLLDRMNVMVTHYELPTGSRGAAIIGLELETNHHQRQPAVSDRRQQPGLP